MRRTDEQSHNVSRGRAGRLLCNAASGSGRGSCGTMPQGANAMSDCWQWQQSAGRRQRNPRSGTRVIQTGSRRSGGRKPYQGRRRRAVVSGSRGSLESRTWRDGICSRNSRFGRRSGSNERGSLRRRTKRCADAGDCSDKRRRAADVK